MRNPTLSGSRPHARRVAVVFPGETSERHLAAPPTWLEDPLFAEASSFAGGDVRRALSGRVPASAGVLQPAMVALALVAWRRLRARRVLPALVAGHGAGEIAAWAASGAIEEHDALKLAALRGAAMQLASIVHPSTRRAVPGGWNAIAMAPAQEALSLVASNVRRFSRDVDHVECHEGRVLEDDEAPDFSAQLVAAPAWRAVIDAFVRAGITDVIVLAPSRPLRNVLTDAFGASFDFHAADSDADLDRLARELAHRRREIAAS